MCVVFAASGHAGRLIMVVCVEVMVSMFGTSTFIHFGLVVTLSRGVFVWM